jgi:hypothetical protein
MARAMISKSPSPIMVGKAEKEKARRTGILACRGLMD